MWSNFSRDIFSLMLVTVLLGVYHFITIIIITTVYKFHESVKLSMNCLIFVDKRCVLFFLLLFVHVVMSYPYVCTVCILVFVLAL